MIRLYQFQNSHFCEKARWALDYKGLPFVRKNLLPGLHVKVAKRLAPRSDLPILVDEETVIQDSTAIITYLDEKFSDRPLTPVTPQEAEEALHWETYLNEAIGVPLRLWFYYHTLPDRERALRFLLDDAPWYGPPLFKLMFPKVRVAMMKLMNIHSESAQQAVERLLTTFQKLDEALKDRRFLVGNSFSRADLTACALLSPLCAPGKSDAEILATLPAPVRDFRDRHQTRRFFTWTIDTYRQYRKPKTEIAARA